MPKIRTPDNNARKHLFSGNNSELIRKTGMTRGTFYARKKHLDDLRLPEVAALIKAQGATEDEIIKIMEVMT